MMLMNIICDPYSDACVSPPPTIPPLSPSPKPPLPVTGSAEIGELIFIALLLILLGATITYFHKKRS